MSLYGFFFVNTDGASVEERGGEDEQRGARGYREVPAAAGQDTASVQHQVPGHRCHHHPCSRCHIKKARRHLVNRCVKLPASPVVGVSIGKPSNITENLCEKRYFFSGALLRV